MRRKNFFLHFCPPFDDRAHRIEKTKPRFFSIAPFLFLFETAPATQESLHRALSESRKETQRQTPALSEKHRSNRTMDEANDALEPVAVLDNDVPKFPIGDRPKTINDLPKELLVSAFEAVDDLRYVRHTVPLVCKAWDELYRSQDASPLHETLEVDFTREEVAGAGSSPPLCPRLEGHLVGREARRLDAQAAPRGRLSRCSRRLQPGGLGQARRRRGAAREKPKRGSDLLSQKRSVFFFLSLSCVFCFMYTQCGRREELRE